ncbi:MAG: hypothetical protein JW795_22915 [Chitinivibrionales bacterium]|nr:hypothetical protein [Chitinivibrionales bacterium]
MEKEKKIKLLDIANEMSFHPTEMYAFFDVENYSVIPVMDEEIRATDDKQLFQELPSWQKENVEVARKILSDKKNFIPLPNQYDIKEYRIIEAFCMTFPEYEKRVQLKEAIKGDGAFRRFREAIKNLQLEEQWYDFKEKQLCQIAKRWCERNRIFYEE